MLPLSKSLSVNLGTGVTAGATVTAIIDRVGYDYASIDLQLEGTSATTALTALTLAQGDDGTAFTNITGFVGGTDFTIPTTMRTLGDPLGQTIVRFDVDCRSRGRYLKISATCGGTNHVRHHTSFYRGDEPPQTATPANVALLVAG